MCFYCSFYSDINLWTLELTKSCGFPADFNKSAHFIPVTHQNIRAVVVVSDLTAGSFKHRSFPDSCISISYEHLLSHFKRYQLIGEICYTWEQVSQKDPAENHIILQCLVVTCFVSHCVLPFKEDSIKTACLLIYLDFNPALCARLRLLHSGCKKSWYPYENEKSQRYLDI